MTIPKENIIQEGVLEDGWQFVIYTKDGRKCIRIFNPTDNKEEKFFAIDTGFDLQYGSPKLEKEPSLRFPVIIDETVYEIAGIVILDENGEIKSRFSLSNLKFNKKQNFSISKFNGPYEFFIDGESQGYLNTIFNIDKNRVIGFEAVFTHVPPIEVQIRELESLGQDSANQNK